MTEWSITKSTGFKGLIFSGSPPRAINPSRIAARSTTAGTPVKSCINTLAGRYAISRGFFPPLVPHSANALISSTETVRPLSSKRNIFSNTTFKAAGNFEKSPNPAAVAAGIE